MASASLSPTQLEDHQLVTRIRSGDQDAFAELYERHFAPVYDFVSRLMRDPAEAEDVVQDTFIQALNNIDQVKDPRRVKGWLFTIARNFALRRLNRAKRSQPLALERDDEKTTSFDLIDPDQLSNPAEAAMAQALSGLVWEIAADLNEDDYALLDLSVRHDFDASEIAEILGITRNNAYVRGNRVRERFERAYRLHGMLTWGRTQCALLSTELETLETTDIENRTARARRVVEHHVEECAICQAHQAELVSPASIFSALVPVPAAPEIRNQIVTRSIEESAQFDGGSRSAQSLRSSVEWLKREAFLISTLVALIGLGLLLLALANTLGDDTSASNRLDPSVATLRFVTEENAPVSGVTVTLEQLTSDGQTPSSLDLTSNESGEIRLEKLDPGNYRVTVVDLPAEFDAIDSTQTTDFTVEPGQTIDINGVFRLITD